MKSEAPYRDGEGLLCVVEGGFKPIFTKSYPKIPQLIRYFSEKYRNYIDKFRQMRDIFRKTVDIFRKNTYNICKNKRLYYEAVGVDADENL